MSNASIDWLSILPVEILHRIFDGLDASTIVLSVRITCRRLKAVVENYDRYALDFRSISKLNFQLLCRLVDPRRITSLTITSEGQKFDPIELFFTNFRVRQLNRLRSLTLINIKENQLKDVVKHFRYTSLTSFALTLKDTDGRRKTTTAKLISSIIARAHLHHLDLDINSDRIERITWPVQCSIKYLKIGYCSDFEPIITVLRFSPHLQTLVVGFSSFNNRKVDQKHSSSTTFHQIKSLTLQGLATNIDTLAVLLSMMPSLIHLKLISTSRDFMNGNQWEQFFQTNLPCLGQFELFIEIRHTGNTSIDMRSILTSFQTPFWLEYKKWFFTCEQAEWWWKYIRLYSIPILKTSITYVPESKKICLSTFDPTVNNNVSIMENINTIEFTASMFTPEDIDQSIGYKPPRNHLFLRVTTLKLRYDMDWLPNLIPFISTLVDLRTVTKITLFGSTISQAKPAVIAELVNFLQQACSLTSLEIRSEYAYLRPELAAKDICALTPANVKYLTTSIKNLDEAKICLEQLQNLTTAKFHHPYNDPSSGSFIEWLEQNRTGSSHIMQGSSIEIWLRNNSMQPKTIEIGNKRMKLVDEYHGS